MLFIIKACLMIMLVNMHCLSHVFGTVIPRCTEITAAIATGAMCLRLLINGKGFRSVKKTVTPMVVFFIYCFATGVGLTIFGFYYVQMVYPLAEKILIMILVSYVIYNDESPNYVLNLCIVTAIATSIATLSGFESHNIRVEINEGMSSNLIGMVASSGVLCLSMVNGRFYNKYIKLGLNILFLCAIVLTASRQSLIIAIIVYLNAWVILLFKDTQKTRRRMVSNFLFIVLVGVTLIYLVGTGFFDVIYETKLYQRLTGANRTTRVSDNARLNMYIYGWKKFWDKPFFGVGYNYVRYIYRYTHSTYMELLIGTGMIGFFIYFIPFIKKMQGFIRGFWQSKSKSDKKYYLEKIIIGLVLIIMMATRSVTYYIFPMVIWTLFICDYNYENSAKKQEQNELERKRS